MNRFYLDVKTGPNDEMSQMSVVIWHINRVVFDEIHYLLEVHCCWKAVQFSVEIKRKNQGGQLRVIRLFHLGG